MRAIIVLLIVSFCYAGSPCEDSLYVVLKSKDLNAMSEREYQYFIEKDKLCNQSYKTEPKPNTIEQVQINNIRREHENYVYAQQQKENTEWIVTAIVCVALLIAIPFATN